MWRVLWTFFRRSSSFFAKVSSYFTGVLFPVEPAHELNLGMLTAGSIFVPVLPVFEKAKDGELKDDDENNNNNDSLAVIGNVGDAGSTVLPLDTLNAFLAEQKRSLNEKTDELEAAFPGGKKKGFLGRMKTGTLITYFEAKLVITTLHGKRVCQSYSDGVDFIESMLREQLIAAIGKVVTAVEFSQYMKYHNRRLFKSAFAPRPFCYAIRRPDHYPEGLISVEAQSHDGSLAGSYFLNGTWKPR